jgi:hypothetical protein
VFLRAIAEECPSWECVAYWSFNVCESETNAHVVLGIGLQKGTNECLYIDRDPIRSALGGRAQVEPFERRSRGMARETSNRGGQLTPEQAREGHRWIRLTVLAAVLQAWMMATVMALLVPRLLALFLVLGAAYSLAAPLLLRYLNRDVERRVITRPATPVCSQAGDGIRTRDPLFTRQVLWPAELLRREGRA